MSEYYSENRTEQKKDKKAMPEYEKKLCQAIKTEWERGEQYVSDLNKLYEDLYSMLRGERPEKNYDWQSNVVINKVFQVVWTAIPYFVQKIFGGKPIIGVKSPDKKGAWQREQILEFWHTMQPASNAKHNPFLLVIVCLLLRGTLNGVSYLKKTWHRKLKRVVRKINIPAGFNTDGSIRMKEVDQIETIPVEDWPYNTVVNNLDIRVDWLLQPGQSCRQGRFIVHRILTDLGSLYSSDINYFNLDKIETKGKSKTTGWTQDHGTNKSKDQQDEFPESDIYTDVEIYERQGMFPVYKTKQDGRWIPCLDPEKNVYEEKDVEMRHMVATYAAGKEDVLIRFEPNPYNELMYIDCHLYLDAERWQSMGMVEPFKDIQTALNDNINAAFDEIWQNLFPPAIFNKYALWDWDTVLYAPHQKWLVGGNPENSVKFREPTQITRDAWQKHLLLDSEIQLTSAVTPPMQGVGKEKAATTNVLNAQMSAGKLDFLIRMIEQTALIPSAQMDVRLAKKFAHPKTLQFILGDAFQYGDFEEIYKYVPAASSVKLEQQREMEVTQDTQLIQVLSGIQNPGVSRLINIILANIFRNREWPELVPGLGLDEEFYEPSSNAGNMQMLNRMIGPGAVSNQNNLRMTGPERNVRQLTYAGNR